MRKIKIGLSILLAITLSFQSTFAQKLITAKELKTKKGVVIIDTRKAEDYAKIHIKGAVNIPTKMLEKDGAVKGLLKSPAQVATILGNHGVSNTSEIVVYCKTATSAGRMFWVLSYLGATNVKVLDGHLTAWREVRGPLTKAKPAITKTTFTPKVNSKILANKAYVKSKASSSSTIIIDGRKAEDYAKGSISGSKNLPKENIVNANNTFKDKASLAALFSKVGAASNKEIIVTCKTGSRAGAMYFVLTEILKYPNVKVYDGSYNEWKM